MNFKPVTEENHKFLCKLLSVEEVLILKLFVYWIHHLALKRF